MQVTWGSIYLRLHRKGARSRDGQLRAWCSLLRSSHLPQVDRTEPHLCDADVAVELCFTPLSLPGNSVVL